MFPDVSDALWGLVDTIVFRKIVKSVVGGRVVETEGQEPGFGGGGFGVGGFDTTDANGGYFEGSLQPMPIQRVRMMPEGERLWKYWTLWTRFQLDPDEVVIDGDGRRFRVMGISDWIGGGYRAYDLVENFAQVPAS